MKKRIFVSVCMLWALNCCAKDYNIRSFGAEPTRGKMNTVAIQAAIDRAFADGGGRVVVPAGNFLTGQLVLKSHVTLHLTVEAVLLGSTNRMDYDEKKGMGLITAVGQEHISITGNGTINGQGRELVNHLMQLLRAGKISDPQWKQKRPTEANRPMLVYFLGCKHIVVKGITMRDASCWVFLVKNSAEVRVDSLTIQSTAYWNNDGIDIVDSRNVHISHCDINTADDGICLKSESPVLFCENILVENCHIRSSASAFKLGTGSLGGFRNIVVRKLDVYDTYRSAIALETVDGAFLENVDIRGVRAMNTGNAIFLRLGHRRTDARPGLLRNIYIADVKVEVPAGKPDIGYPMEGPVQKYPHNVFPSSITGIPGHPVENVVLENIEIVYEGGASPQTAFFPIDSLNRVAENMAGYPEFSMFGELPAWGFYTRHAKNIVFRNVVIATKKEDFRAAMVFDDVEAVKLEKLAIPSPGKLPAVVLKDVSREFTGTTKGVVYYK